MTRTTFDIPSRWFKAALILACVAVLVIPNHVFAGDTNARYIIVSQSNGKLVVRKSFDPDEENLGSYEVKSDANRRVIFMRDASSANDRSTNASVSYSAVQTNAPTVQTRVAEIEANDAAADRSRGTASVIRQLDNTLEKVRTSLADSEAALLEAQDAAQRAADAAALAQDLSDQQENDLDMDKSEIKTHARTAKKADLEAKAALKRSDRLIRKVDKLYDKHARLLTKLESQDDGGGDEGGDDGNGGNGGDDDGNGGNGGGGGGGEGNQGNDGSWLNDDIPAGDDPQPVINLLASSSSRMAPAAVFVHATDSIPQSADFKWQRARFQWDFGQSAQDSLMTTDPRTGDDVVLTYEQQGFNTAYVYEDPGDYTISMRATNEDGRGLTTQTSVTIVPDTRVTRYVSSSTGSDSNDGLTEETAWRTYDWAMRRASDDMRILFKRGDVFNVDNSDFNSPGDVDNFMLDAYGTGELPTLRWIDDSTGEIFNPAGGSENLIIRNLRFECTADIETATCNAIATGSDVVVTIWDCEFVGEAGGQGFNRWVENHSGDGADGLLVLNCSGGASWAYNFTLGGDEEDVNGAVYIGMVTEGSVNEAVNRGSFEQDHPATRLNFQFCDLRNQAGSKESLRLQTTKFANVYRSVLTGMQVSHKHYLTDYTVVDKNVLWSGGDINCIYTTDNIQNLMVRNNVFEVHNDYRNAITAGSGSFEVGIHGLDVLNNTFRNVAPNRGKNMLSLRSDIPISGLRVCNNMFLVQDAFNDPLMGLPAEASILEVSGNVFPDRGDSFRYVAVDGTKLMWDEFLALDVVLEQTRSGIGLANVAAPLYGFDDAAFADVAAAGRVITGVFGDMHGQRRMRDQSRWPAGAAQPITSQE